MNLSKSNLVPRIVVGTLVGVFLYNGLAERPLDSSSYSPGLLAIAVAARSPVVVGDDVGSQTRRLVDLAQKDHIALLQWAMEHYRTGTQDYQAMFYKQERINGKLRPQEAISVKFKDKPFSVLMSWDKNADRINKLLYVETPGAKDHKMIVHPTGIFSWISSVKRDPRGKDALQYSRRTCDQFGFYRTMEGLLDVYRQAQKNGDLEISYLGMTVVDDRPCVRLERVLPAKKEYPYARLVLDFDVEYLVPTAVASYDWQGKMLGSYTYEDVKFNSGLADEVFSAKANGL